MPNRLSVWRPTDAWCVFIAAALYQESLNKNRNHIKKHSHNLKIHCYHLSKNAPQKLCIFYTKCIYRILFKIFVVPKRETQTTWSKKTDSQHANLINGFSGFTSSGCLVEEWILWTCCVPSIPLNNDRTEQKPRKKNWKCIKEFSSFSGCCCHFCFSILWPTYLMIGSQPTSGTKAGTGYS